MDSKGISEALRAGLKHNENKSKGAGLMMLSEAFKKLNDKAVKVKE